LVFGVGRHVVQGLAVTAAASAVAAR